MADVMRNRLSVAVGYLLTAWLILSPRAAHAAAIRGRVMDSAGQPVAGAEVRIWQKLPVPAGRGVSDQQANFGDGDVLITDAEGRFATPDVLVGEAFAYVVAEAEGPLAGRSGWIEIGKDALVTAPDIVLARLRAVTGQVLDRQGQPVAGATVFNSGDGDQRVETKTGRNGKFFLDGVPEGQVFLFAEKPGYRFTGINLPAGESVAAFTLASLDETAEPLVTLPPLNTAEEETALAHEVLDPWLAEVIQSGDEMRKLTTVGALSHIDPLGWPAAGAGLR